MLINQTELIENYLEGNLSGKELSDFEERLKDPSFSEKVERHREVINQFKGYHQRAALKDQLNTFHEDLEKPKINRERKFLPYWKRHYPTMAIAASVALLAVFLTIFTMNYLSSLENKQQAYYKALKRDIEKIKKSQNNIIKEKNEEPVIIIPNTGGTGFVVSTNGYIITSNHLIKGATMLQVENAFYKAMNAIVVYQSEERDLAIIKITDSTFEGFANLPYAIRKDQMDLGEQVFTLGFPKDDVVFGEGSVSAISGYNCDTAAYQISVPVNPGNSGSPLFDSKGNIAGLVSGTDAHLAGSSFAIKSEYISECLQTFRKDSAILALSIPDKNKIAALNRVSQLKKIKPYIFQIKIFERL